MNKETLKKISEKNKDGIDVGISLLGYGRTHFATKDFKKYEVVAQGYGRITNHQTARLSIQIGKDKHMIPAKWTGRYWNHSCEPNTYIRSRKGEFPDLIASRNIAKGEEITYAYWMSEFEWSSNAEEVRVTCGCKKNNCDGRIYAFSELPRRTRGNLIKAKKTAEYIRNLILRDRSS